MARFISLRSYFSAAVLQSELFRSPCCKLCQRTRTFKKRSVLSSLKVAATGMKDHAEKEACVPSGGTGACSPWEPCVSLVTSTSGQENVRAVSGGGIFFRLLLLVAASGFTRACRVWIPVGQTARVSTTPKRVLPFIWKWIHREGLAQERKGLSSGSLC